MSGFQPKNDPLILIVDDDLVIRSLMRDALEDEGFIVVEAENGVEACRSCDERVPSLLVVDVMMPEMDGFALCRALRARSATAHVPILMATGLDDVESIATAYDAGATDFIAKPLNWMILIHRIRYMLRGAMIADDLRLSQERLRVARDVAEAADRAKSEFLANVSHELRTPLNAIIGFSTIMSQGMYGPLNDRYQDYAKVITESGTHLLSIINDILDVAKAATQSLSLSEQDVAFADVVSHCARMTAEMIEKAEIHSSFEIEAGLPTFSGDEVKLRQILINLLSNAIKFTPVGGRIAVTVKRQADGELALLVKDTGIGIPAEKMSVALAPFGQVDSDLNRKYAGVGLGLPLTKRLVELHDGTMAITSDEGQGTLVSVLFPAHRLRDHRRYGEAVPVSPPDEETTRRVDGMP